MPLLAVALAVLASVAWLVSTLAIDVATSRGLLPRWDLAAHLLNGWTDYHLLTSWQWPQLAWDVWQQGYWPPGQSLFQMPFYIASGGRLIGGQWSSVAAFVLCGLAGTALLGIIWKRAAWLPAALFLACVATSPFFLAYASVAMSEMLGALAQTAVLLAHVRYDQARSASAARGFALALTALFFTKYNYFILLAVPLATHIYLTHTAGMTAGDRVRQVVRWTRALLGTWIGALVAVTIVVALAVEATGGFAFTLAGQRVAFRTTGYLAHPALYLLLAQLWLLTRRGQIDWTRVWAIDPRLRPLGLWFGIPVALWLASPYPNHIKDAMNLIVNIPLGEPTARAGLLAYVTAVRHDYFPSDWVLAIVLAAFAVAAAQYRRQPPAIQLLILVAALECAMVAVHQTRSSRFLLLAMPPLWLVSASELGGAMARRSPRGAVAVAVLVAPARSWVRGPRCIALRSRASRSTTSSTAPRCRPRSRRSATRSGRTIAWRCSGVAMPYRPR